MGSGSVGAAFALVISLLAGTVGVWLQAVALVLTMTAALISVRPFAASEGDPGWVVIDEAAGTFVATLGLALPGAIVAWFVFRAADIFKGAFPGVARAESLPGAVGVVADDVVAGLYGLAAGWLVHSLL